MRKKRPSRYTLQIHVCCCCLTIRICIFVCSEESKCLKTILKMIYLCVCVAIFIFRKPNMKTTTTKKNKAGFLSLFILIIEIFLCFFRKGQKQLNEWKEKKGNSLHVFVCCFFSSILPRWWLLSFFFRCCRLQTFDNNVCLKKTQETKWNAKKIDERCIYAIINCC